MSKKIGVFCSGGDAPGMNACVRAVVRSAIGKGHKVVGIKRGYQGLLNEEFYLNSAGQPEMTLASVNGWSKYGGAFLHSSRSPEFATLEGQQKAAEILRRHEFDALIPIGGDGTFTGAIELAKQWDGQIVGCPGTIDNDLVGTDYTIGFSTAVQTAVEAVDKISDTAASHDRMFLIEVMGRHSGYIGIYTALASGAEVTAIPETMTDIPEIIKYLNVLKNERGKRSVMMIVSEGDEEGRGEEINQKLIDSGCPYKSRVVVLGHLQRGGTPSPEDRRRATQMGAGAVSEILNGSSGIMVGTHDDQCTTISLEEAIKGNRMIPENLITLLDEMAS